MKRWWERWWPAFLFPLLGALLFNFGKYFSEFREQDPIIVIRDGPTDVFTIPDGGGPTDDCGEFYGAEKWHPDRGHPSLCDPKLFSSFSSSNVFHDGLMWGMDIKNYIDLSLHDSIVFQAQDNGKPVLTIVDKDWHAKNEHPNHPAKGKVTLYGCGAMVFSDDYEPDEAAVEFWKALIRTWPQLVFGALDTEKR